MSRVSDDWERGQVDALYAFLLALADHYTRDVVRKTTGMSLLGLVGGLFGGRTLANLTAAAIYDGESWSKWQEAETRMYNWYGAEQTFAGTILNVIPNPFEVGRLIGDSTLMIHDHYAVGNLKSSHRPHGSFIRTYDYYLEHGTTSGSRINAPN